MNQNDKFQSGVQLDMTPDGQFRSPSSAPGGSPASNKIMRIAIIVAAVAGAGMLASLALSLALALIPIVFGAGIVAYGIIRYRMWKSGVSFRRSGFPLR